MLGDTALYCVEKNFTCKEMRNCELEGGARERIIANNNMLNISGWLTVDYIYIYSVYYTLQQQKCKTCLS